MKTIVQLVLIDETGDSYYRMRWPGRALCDQDPEICLINLDARSTERFELAKNADLLVLFQSNDLDMIELIEERRRAKKKTIVEYNDNFYAPPPCSPVFGPWSSPTLWQTYETIMKKGDHLIVTGEGLKNLLSPKVTCEVSILENHIYDSCPKFDTCWNDSEEFRIGWAGSVGHMSDLLAILPYLEEFCLTHSNAKLYLMGNESIPSYVKLPKDKYVYTHWGAMADYYKFLENIHIGVAPLADSPYNHCRSDIKAIEYASRGALPIVQELTPYEKLIAKKVVQSFDSFSGLTKLLTLLYSNKSELKSKTKHAYDYVMNERLAIKNKERLDLYLGQIEAKSKKSLGYKAGYHEIMGTTKTELDCMKAVAKTQELYKNKDYTKAIDHIKKHKSILEYEPTFVLLLAECIKQTDIEEAEEILIDGAQKFPQDLRFKIQALKLHTTSTEKLSRWLNLVDFLERQENHFIAFYESMVCTAYLTDLKNELAPLEVGLKLCELYSNNFDLLFAIGEACFKSKRYQDSFKLLNIANNIFEVTNKKSQIKQDANQYLLTLIEAADYAQRME